MNRRFLTILALFLCLAMLLCACNRPTGEPAEEPTPTPEPSVEEPAEPEQEPEQEPPMSEIARKLEENTPFEIVDIYGNVVNQNKIAINEHDYFTGAAVAMFRRDALLITFKPSNSDPEQKPTPEDFPEIAVLDVKSEDPRSWHEEYQDAPHFWQARIQFEPLDADAFFDLATKLSLRKDVHLVEIVQTGFGIAD